VNNEQLLVVTVTISLIAMLASILSIAVSPLTRAVLGRWRAEATPATKPAEPATVSSGDDERARLEIERLDFKRAMDEYREGYRLLIKQIERLGEKPEWKPNGRLKAIEAGTAPLVSIYDLINQFFNDGELDDLAFRLSLPAGELGSGATSQRVRALIGYCNRRGRLQALLAMCRQLRPFVEWPELN
jgi:hypothetical protein